MLSYKYSSECPTLESPTPVGHSLGYLFGDRLLDTSNHKPIIIDPKEKDVY